MSAAVSLRMLSRSQALWTRLIEAAARTSLVPSRQTGTNRR
jgi:hypothetical protein